VPEVLITTKSAMAAQRPLAGFGAGAFCCDGVWVGSTLPAETVPAAGAAKGTGLTAALALPRVKRSVAAISQGYAPAGVSGAVSPAGTQAKTEQFEHLTRINPVVPGGVGPHPAREPEPV
jgi:hypothetical protein